MLPTACLRLQARHAAFWSWLHTHTVTCVVCREAASMDVHLDALEHAARDLREYSAAAPKSELYQDLACCISSLVTWLRLRADSACKPCSGSDIQEGVCQGGQVPLGSSLQMNSMHG